MELVAVASLVMVDTSTKCRVCPVHKLLRANANDGTAGMQTHHAFWLWFVGNHYECKCTHNSSMREI